MVVDLPEPEGPHRTIPVSYTHLVQVHSGLPNLHRKFEEVLTTCYGAIDQLGERLLCTQEVCGSIPHSSTISDVYKRQVFLKPGNGGLRIMLCAVHFSQHNAELNATGVIPVSYTHLQSPQLPHALRRYRSNPSSGFGYGHLHPVRRLSAVSYTHRDG